VALKCKFALSNSVGRRYIKLKGHCLGVSLIQRLTRKQSKKVKSLNLHYLSLSLSFSLSLSLSRARVLFYLNPEMAIVRLGGGITIQHVYGGREN
jgi:hypothetical protein